MTNNYLLGRKLIGNVPAMLIKILGSIFLLALSLSVDTASAMEETSSEVARFLRFTKEVRCVVCQNQNLAESNAPLAKDLRDKIHKMILEKKSDEEIKDYLIKRYGEFILLRPRLNKLTYFLWAFPLLGCIFIMWYLFYYKFSDFSQKRKS